MTEHGRLRTTLVTADAPGRDVVIAIGGQTITGIEPAAAAALTGDILDLHELTAVAGFVDQHSHGGGGGSFTSADPGQIQRAVDFHAQHGTTTIVASLVSASHSSLVRQIDALAPFVANGTIAGIHLEGPWISERHCGAHDRAALRAPALDEVAELLSVSPGAIAMVTIAPELPGAMAAIEMIAAAGAIAAIGHTAADIPTTLRAVDAGATVATHLFNGMPKLDHRDPGPAGALLADPRVAIELIADHHHVHPVAIDIATRAAGIERTVLVTDAIDATGEPDGRYVLGDVDIEVRDGVSRVVATGSLAGSTLTMDGALRGFLSATGASLGDASAVTAANPARLLRRTDRGAVEVGKRADIVLLDSQHQVAGVMRAGEWVIDPSAACTR